MREFPIRSGSAYLYERAWRKDIFVQYLLQPIDSSRKRSVLKKMTMTETNGLVFMSSLPFIGAGPAC